MVMEAVKIPQNVYVEDRIVGPLTLKQLIIIGLGSGFSYILYSTVVKYTGTTNIVLTIVLWIPALISVAFAFLKINDLSLFNIILLMIEKANKPSLRMWTPHPGISINIVTSSGTKVDVERKLRQEADTSRLTELARQLEDKQKQMIALTGSQDTVTLDIVAAPTIPPPSAPTKTAEEIPAKESAQAEAVEPDETTATAKAVDASRVQASSMNRSIDGIAGNLSKFSHLFDKDSH